MIYRKGDAVEALLTGEVDYLLHVCNCQGVMGSGIALQIKNKIPEAFRSYKHHESVNGKVILGKISSGGNVVNLHAQEFYGIDGNRYLNYEALITALEQTNKCLSKFPRETKIAIPYLMGCDRAGGDWDIVSTMVDKVITSVDNVYCYQL